MDDNRRATFRVAVRDGAPIEADLHWSEQTWSATIGDVSAEGMFVELHRGQVGPLGVNSPIEVEVRFGGESVVLHGIVRSTRGNGYGVHFPARDLEGRVNPREVLARISASLQREDLSQRLRVLRPEQYRKARASRA
jgi:hypothetical protein